MKKVIILSDLEHLPKGVLEFAALLNEQAPIMLTGVFLTPRSYQDIVRYFSGTVRELAMSMQAEDETVLTESAINEFERFCTKNGIQCRVHELVGRHFAEDLRKETVFADLMLFSNHAFPNLLEQELTSTTDGELIHHAGCPVIIVPPSFVAPNQVILAYDGSPSSVFAIKQYAALLPAMCKLDTLVAYMNDDQGTDLPEKAHIEELAACHFPNLTFFKYKIEPKKHFAPWLSNQSKTLLVTGAFGRNALSRALRKSFVEDVIQAQEMPLFIAHH